MRPPNGGRPKCDAECMPAQRCGSLSADQGAGRANQDRLQPRGCGGGSADFLPLSPPGPAGSTTPPVAPRWRRRSAPCSAPGPGGGVGLYVDTDAKDSTRYLVHVTQCGIVALETKLAAAHWDMVKRRDADLTYDLPTFIELRADAVGLDWAGRLAALGSSPRAVADLVVRPPDHLAALASLWSGEDLDDGKCWAHRRVILARAPWLPDALVAEDFAVLRPETDRRRADHQGRLSDEVAGRLEAGNRPRRPRRQLSTRLRGQLAAATWPSRAARSTATSGS